LNNEKEADEGFEMKKYKVSEIFFSPQGEGRYTGQLTAWVRFFLCNLQCAGFGQNEPTKPETYITQDIDVSKYSRLEDLPIIEYGCDSAYSWSAKFKHLCPSYDASEIAQKIIDSIPTFNMNHSGVAPHLAFTGGEPMLKQEAIIDVVESLLSMPRRDDMLVENLVNNITIETNGTQHLDRDFVKYFALKRTNLFMSVSPKLFNVSGEHSDKAIQPEIISEYDYMTEGYGQLKFVMNNRKESWDELEDVINQIRKARCHYPVYIMPVGSSKEQQLDADVTAIAEEAVRRGYNISGRMHSYLFGNGMGK
jgi:organic radical activating enzyme